MSCSRVPNSENFIKVDILSVLPWSLAKKFSFTVGEVESSSSSKFYLNFVTFIKYSLGDR